MRCKPGQDFLPYDRPIAVSKIGSTSHDVLSLSPAPPASPQILSNTTSVSRNTSWSPKTQHLVSLFSQKITSPFVFFHFVSVLLSVKFDYQSMFATYDVRVPGIAGVAWSLCEHAN
jgi:hypothetical protein